MRDQGLRFVEVIKKLLMRLLEYRTMIHDESKDIRMNCIVNLLVRPVSVYSVEVYFLMHYLLILRLLLLVQQETMFCRHFIAILTDRKCTYDIYTSFATYTCNAVITQRLLVPLCSTQSCSE